MVLRAMAAVKRPPMKRKRAEDASRCESKKKQMIDEEIEMDENLKTGLGKILKDLLNQSRGWAFSEPPEVKIPADLAAVERKLKQNLYSGEKEFVDDVRLAFENAKPYSPRWAAVLDANFMRQWKKLESRIKNFDHLESSSSSSSVVSDQEVSPEKALRAAMLKTRFADTILKATQKLQLPEKKCDFEKDLKERRERERRALEEIERRADVDDTAATLKMWFGPTGYPTPRTLQRLGLYAA